MENTPREIYTANPTTYDVVHWAVVKSNRCFSPLCAPDVLFWGDQAVEIPGKAPRCKTCAHIRAQKKKDEHGTDKRGS